MARRIAFLLAALALSGVAAAGGGDHAAAPAPAAASDCFADPADAACAGFEMSVEETLESLHLICGSNVTNARGVPVGVPYAPGCTLLRECGLDTDEPVLMASSDGEFIVPANVTAECEPFVLLATLCAGDAATTLGCEGYNALCADDTAVEQCDALPPLDAAANMTAVALQGFVQGMCAYHADHVGRIYLASGVSYPDPRFSGRRRLLHNGVDHSVMGPGHGSEVDPSAVPHGASAHEACVSCLKTGESVSLLPDDCPDAMAVYSVLCAEVGGSVGVHNFDKNCNAWRAFCGEHASAFPALCEAEDDE